EEKARGPGGRGRQASRRGARRHGRVPALSARTAGGADRGCGSRRVRRRATTPRPGHGARSREAGSMNHSIAPHGGHSPGAREAFEAWWQKDGYTEPDDTDDRDAWDAYHLRYGLAWTGFVAGWKARGEQA